jgi:hypothetical protein
VLLKRTSFVALCVWLALVQGCRTQSAPLSNLTIEYEVSPLPARVGDVTITVKMTDAAGKGVAGARVSLEGTMSHAGMAPVFAEAKEIEPGRYRSNMRLTMAGDWHVMVHLTLPDGRELDQQFEIKEVAPD